MIADERLSLFEYTLRCVLHRHLDACFLPRRQTRQVHRSAQKLAGPVATVLALLAWEGQPQSDQAARAFDVGMRGYIGGITPTDYRLARSARSPSSTRRCKRSITPRRPSNGGSWSPARIAYWRTSRSPSAKRSCSAPFGYPRLPAAAPCPGGSGRTMNAVAGGLCPTPGGSRGRRRMRRRGSVGGRGDRGRHQRPDWQSRRPTAPLPSLGVRPQRRPRVRGHSRRVRDVERMPPLTRENAKMSGMEGRLTIRVPPPLETIRRRFHPRRSRAADSRRLSPF